MNEELILQDFNNFKKSKDILKEHNISREKLKEIMNKRYSAKELEAFKWERSHQRTEGRKAKYWNLYHTDPEYQAKKKRMALLRYYLKKEELKNK